MSQRVSGSAPTLADSNTTAATGASLAACGMAILTIGNSLPAAKLARPMLAGTMCVVVLASFGAAR